MHLLSKMSKPTVPPIPSPLPQETAYKQGTSCLPVFKDDSCGMPSCFLLSLNIWLSLNSAAASYAQISMLLTTK